MIPLQKSDLDPFVRLQQLLKRKSQEVRAEFEPQLGFIERAYASFDCHTPEFMSVAGIRFGDDSDDLWRELYRFDQADIASLKEQLDIQLDGVCWYCRIAPADSLDHVLPQRQNPLYTVHSSNLIPACTACNRKKGELNAISRDTVYPYGEIERSLRWLFARIELVGGDIEVRFFADFARLASARSREVMARHIDEMGICETYARHFARLGRSDMVGRFGYLRGGREVVEAITAILPGYEVGFGPNYYLSVGMEALSLCNDETIAAFLRK
ncbi:MAG: HNH endonuclease signature motif containing protein [Archangium sp.]|nr:HNH endonuclease signature motif containing protein [Archangium sp.]MDP3574708.1 HNH endonuclease signature motif containing protein [Archangium sp.]